MTSKTKRNEKLYLHLFIYLTQDVHYENKRTQYRYISATPLLNIILTIAINLKCKKKKEEKKGSLAGWRSTKLNTDKTKNTIYFGLVFHYQENK
jgi:hypothetical protein